MTIRAPEHALAERHQLCRAHRDIEPILTRIDALAEMAGNLSSPDLDEALRTLLDSMAANLLPHFEWEEGALIPALDPSDGSHPSDGLPSGGHLLCQQHAQIRQGLERLAVSRMALRHEPTHRQLGDLRARLYGLHALLYAHLEQEEDALLPALGEAILAETQAGSPDRTAPGP